jgi:hypothetical protein
VAGWHLPCRPVTAASPTRHPGQWRWRRSFGLPPVRSLSPCLPLRAASTALCGATAESSALGGEQLLHCPIFRFLSTCYSSSFARWIPATVHGCCAHVWARTIDPLHASLSFSYYLPCPFTSLSSCRCANCLDLGAPW